MKKVFDIIQILLTELGPFSFLVSVFLIWVAIQSGKILSFVLGALAKAFKAVGPVVYNPFTIKNGLVLALLGGLVYMNGQRVSNLLQYIEQSYLEPTYVNSEQSFFVEGKFEETIKRYTNEAQFLIIRDSTRALAKEIGCQPQDIYLVAYSECGLDPFKVRTDGIAAGWIQFTRVGLNGLGRSLEEVKQSCAAKDATELMRLTGAYIRRAAKGRTIGSATDFYCAVFAPGKLSASMDGVLYSGFNNPEYYLNAGLDGYFVENEKVLHLPRLKDGKLTKRDLMAALEYKKSKLLVGR